MRILLFSQYFPPEVTAASGRLRPLASGLAARGHHVEVISELPNHPEGVIREGYRGRIQVRREEDGYCVRHVWVRPSPVKTQKSRAIFYGTYALSALVAGVASRRPDVILTSSPPLPAAAAAMAVAGTRRVPWVMDVRDPWPEAAVALGELTNPRTIDWLERLERRMYRSAAEIVTVTEPFREDIAAKLGDDGKITIVPNGTTDAWIEVGERDEDRNALGMPEDRFVLTYAGNVGIAQGMEAVTEAARMLGEGFQLQIVGAGPRLGAVEELAASLPPGRVVFRGLVEPDLAARYLRASDATLVPLGKAPELAKFVPSKLFDCCAVGRPVIVSVRGEASRLAEEAGAALCIAPEDPTALVEAVKRLQSDPALVSGLVGRGRDFARRYRREAGVERFEEVLERAVASRR